MRVRFGSLAQPGSISQSRRRCETSRRRSGFTLIELLVVISIIATLAALILPGVQQARETARRTECLNNMRNVSMAMQNFAADKGGELPPLYGGDVVVDDTGAGEFTWGPASWSVHLLPYLEQRGLYDRLLDTTVRGPGETLASLATTNVNAYTCPDDPNDAGPGAMSYVVNAGYAAQDAWALNNATSHTVSSYNWAAIDTGAGSAENINVSAATGVFFPVNANFPDSTDGYSFAPQGYSSSIDRVSTGDGLSQTIFLTENMETPNWAPGIANPAVGTISGGSATMPAGNGGFVGYRLGDLGFAVRTSGTSPDPNNNTVDGGYGPADTGTADDRFALVASAAPFANGSLMEQSFINERVGIATSGESPRPSSLHPAVVNVIFGDGSGRNLSQNIDGSVYLRLVSSNGNRYGQGILSNKDY